ncbi:kin of IRRE-like protein 1 [Branchiostoma lanceolatum]|uniref:kin of IRRE-like protein 1 n=1 Tax=Branchiostoma lanceolatum TaxID=7740 RepID=UPI003452C5DD
MAEPTVVVYTTIAGILSITLAVLANSTFYRVYPVSTAVLVGHNATMFCAFNGLADDDVVNWHKYNPSASNDKLSHVSSGTVVGPEFRRRFSVVGDNQSGEFNLRLTNAQPRDAGSYRCGVFSVRDARDAKLTVIVPLPRQPIVLGDLNPRTAGKSLILTCRSVGGSPLPQLAWYNGTQRMDIPDSARTEEPSENRVSLDLVISFLTKWDNGANFSCIADQEFPSVVQPKVTSVTIRVQYPPVVKMPKMSVVVIEGQSANLTCEVDSSPGASLSWWKLKKNLREGPLGSGTLLTLTNVTRNDRGTYQCRAINGVKPDGLGTMALDVKYPPYIRPSFPKEQSVIYGQGVFSMDCQAEGNPKPQVKWRRKDVNMFFNNPMTLSDVGYLEEGFYECIARSEGFREVRRGTFINVIGRPEVLSDSSAVSVTGGDSVRLSCTILADPPPDKITWLWTGPSGDERRYDGGRTGDVEVKTIVENAIRSELTIKSAMNAHVGDYTCQAINKFGSDQKEFRVSVTGSAVAVVGVIAGSAAVGMLLAIAAIVALSIRKGWIGRDKKKKKSSKPTESLAYCISGRSTMDYPVIHSKKADTLNQRNVIELQHFDKTPRPRPPPKVDKSPYTSGLSYSSSNDAGYDHSSAERDKLRDEDIYILRNSYYNKRQHRQEANVQKC